MKRIIFVFSLITPFTFSQFAQADPSDGKFSFSVGTSYLEIAHGFNSSLGARLYLHHDYKGHILDQGLEIKGSSFRFKLSNLGQDNLLKNSILAKIEYRTIKKISRRIVYEGTHGLGFFRLPSLFSCETDFKPLPLSVWAFRLSESLRTQRPMRLSRKLALTSEVGLKGVFSTDAEHSSSWEQIVDHAQAVSAFSYLQGNLGLRLNRRVRSNFDVYSEYRGSIRTSAYAPITPLFNQEVSIGFKTEEVRDNEFGLSLHLPLQSDLIEAESLNQKRRINFNLSRGWGNSWQLSSKVAYAEDDYTDLILSLLKSWGDSHIQAFLYHSPYGNSYGIQFLFRRGEVNRDLISQIYEHRPSFRGYCPSICPHHPTPPDSSVWHSFEEMVNWLNTPEKVVWYANFVLAYLHDHNNEGGLFNAYTPKEVFDRGGGNCTEKSGFQAYCLSRNGYEAYAVGFTARSITHAVCVFKDRNTGKWNVLDRGKYYRVGADSIEEAMDRLFPGWISFDIIDPASISTLTQVESITKRVILNWFEDN